MADIIKILKPIKITGGQVLQPGELFEVWFFHGDGACQILINSEEFESIWLYPDEFEYWI